MFKLHLMTTTRHAATPLMSMVLLTAVLGAGACGGGGSSPTAPSAPTATAAPTPTTPATPTMLAVFKDPASSFSTSDVRDAQGRVVRFDIPTNSLVWTADGRMFTGYPVLDTYYIRNDKFFQVRFGTKNGEQRAYFTEAGRGTLCDIQAVGSGVVITPTDLPVPKT